MKIGLFADHAGFLLKENIKTAFPHIPFIDFGTHSIESVDYPHFGMLAGEKMTCNDIDYAFLVCGTGIGITIAANRYTHVRAFVAHTLDEVIMARKHNDANAMGFSGRTQKIEDIIPFIEAFLSTEFEGGRHQKRVDLLSDKTK
jgi:ribose 5-phosphate isomerase B